MNKLIALMFLVMFGCGGIGDTTDIDTHLLEVTRIEQFDGSPEQIIIKDLGFDRDAYLAAVEASAQENLGDGVWVNEYGQTAQALTHTGRYGIDSQASATSTETRCPSPPYTGCANCNPGGNYCQASDRKNFVYGVDASIPAWDATFGSSVQSQFTGALTFNSQSADGNGGWEASVSTTPGVPKFKLMDSQQYAGPAVTTNVLAPITIALPDGARLRKWTADANGWFGIITTNFTFMYANGFLSNNQTNTFRKNVMQNIFRHEHGHMMGLGHRPVGAGEARNIMALNAGLGNTTYTFMTDQKNDLTGYVP